MNKVTWVKSPAQYDDSIVGGIEISRAQMARNFHQYRANGFHICRSTPMRMVNYAGKPRVQRRYLITDSNDNVVVVNTYNFRVER